MRLTLTFQAESSIIFPVHYNEQIQGFIYRHLNPVIAGFLHDTGYTFEKRKYTLFTFSRLMGKRKVAKEQIEFRSPLKLIISSPLDPLLQSLAEHLIRKKSLKIGENTLFLESIAVGFKPTLERETVIKMLSPVTIYSTLESADGRKKTYYYNPLEKEFSKLARENIVKKYKALNGTEPPSKDFQISPLTFDKRNEVIVKYKGFIIKGWMGKFILKGERELLQLAYDAGIGSKNSQGFGCFEVV